MGHGSGKGRQKSRIREWLLNGCSSVGCHYCGKKLGSREFTLDHVTPISAGGKTNRSNIVPACEACNQKKASKTYSEFMREVRSSC